MKAFFILGVIILVAFSVQSRSWAQGTAESAPAQPTEWQATSRSAGNRPAGNSSSVGESFREGPTGGVWQRSQLLGDPGGFRSFLSKYGASLTIQETSELLGNVTGGTRQGFDYDGLTTIDFQVDTKRAFGLYGGLFNASALQVHGSNLSARRLGTLQTASGIEADPGFRIWELWYQQLFDFNQIDVKLGNQSLDQEFMVSQYAGLFLNTMFGWAMLPSADMLGGGPAYPMASMGVRFRAQPAGTPWAFLIGVFDDNPSGLNSLQPTVPDSQLLNINGTNFRMNDRALVIFETQFSRPAMGQLEYADQEPILPGTYKVGFWYDFGQFADQEYGTDGLSLANSNSNGLPKAIQGNYSFYGVIDQLLWRRSAESPEGIGFFFRAMTAPDLQNQINFSMNAGFSWHAPFKHREYDTLGFGVGETNVSSRARSLDQDNANFGTNTYNPIRSSETFLELTYQYQLVPWWQLQPDFQYTFNPGAGIANSNNPTQSIGNEFVFGLRTNIAL